MATFYPRQTPAHKRTKLRIVCEQEAGKTGRYKLTAFDGDRFVASQFYQWNIWLGHCCGAFLVDAFVDYAEEQAKPKSRCAERGGCFGGNCCLS